jgi:CRP/FNR family nitrogen fixation transcriptional regulator
MTAQIVTFARTAQTSHDDVRSLPGATIAYRPGDEIYAQAEETDLIYRVVSGAVRTTRLDSDGRRQIGDFYYAGDFFGLEAGPEHRFSAEALCDAQIQVLKRSSLAVADEAGGIERMIWMATARELERTREHLMMLGRKTAREKVASFLFDLADRQGGDIQTLTMGRQDMADYLGLTIETVSRMLTQLQSEGLVTFMGCRQFRIGNRPALTRLVAA